jgi:hypothetical protein
MRPWLEKESANRAQHRANLHSKNDSRFRFRPEQRDPFLRFARFANFVGVREAPRETRDCELPSIRVYAPTLSHTIVLVFSRQLAAFKSSRSLRRVHFGA